jgi:hypothetical protein
MYRHNYLSMMQFDKSTTFAAVDVYRLLHGRAEEMDRVLEQVFYLVRDSVLGSAVLQYPKRYRNIDLLRLGM